METKTTRVKIIGVSGVLTSASVKSTTRHINVTVIELPSKNPYGKDFSSTAVPFDVQIHNNNIEAFNVNSNHIGYAADVELILVPYKKDQQSAAVFNMLVNSIDIIV